MMRTFKKIVYPVIISSVVLLTACGDDDDSDGGNATVPANAITIDDNNAALTLSAALKNRGFVEAFNTGSISIRDVIAVINGARDGIEKTPKSAIAAAHDTVTVCTGGGNATYSYSQSGNTKTGNLTFNACLVGTFTLSGGWTYSETSDPETSIYDKSFTGSVTMTGVVGEGETVTISLGNLDFAETGNKTAGTFTTTKFTLSMNFTISGISALGYLVELTFPIVESDGDLCPESGTIRLTGANGTYAEIIYNSNNTHDIIANGTLVADDVACLSLS